MAARVQTKILAELAEAGVDAEAAHAMVVKEMAAN